VNYSRSEADARETLKLVEACHVRGLLVQCDVGSDAAVRDMVHTVEREFGRLDVLVNNAGTTWFIDHKNLEEMTEEKWDRILQVNLKGPFFCIRAAVPLMRKSGGGAIVSVSSVAGLSGEGSSIAYAASKGALNTMTRSLARALGPEIRVNAVCPGPVDTRWLRAVMTPEELEKRTAGFPMKRPALPEDIADAVIYLASGTSLTTGQCLVVDGGRTM
jgi:3-oxoacyl-[acyl-carrier protein] reductase